MATPDRFTFAELFSGVGGFRVGLEAIGGRCVFACEYCKFAKTTYRHNWPEDPSEFVVGDVCMQATPTIPPADVLVAGFPCQSFSNAGRKLAFGDERGQLFYELVRIVTAVRFRALLLENVRGLLEPAVLAEVTRCLTAAGYTVQTREVDAAQLLPQRRRRVFIVCFRSEAARRLFEWPVLPALRRSAEEVLQTGVVLPSDLELPKAKWDKVRSSDYFGRFPGARLLQPGALAQTLQTSYRSGYLLYSQFVPPRDADAGCGCGGGDGDEDDGVAPVAPPRFFSGRECARLMGFPEGFALPDDALASRQMGNAVCPPVIGAIGACVVHALEAAAGAPASEDEAVDTAEAEVEVAAAARRREAATCEALWAALRLVLEAAPAERLPTHAWLPPTLAQLLGLTAATGEASASTAGGDDAASDTRRPPCGCAVGGAFHEPPERGWARWPIPDVVSRAESKRGDGTRRLPSRDPAAPTQTLPAPTRAAKAAAALGMRRLECVWALRDTAE